MFPDRGGGIEAEGDEAAAEVQPREARLLHCEVERVMK